MQNDHFSMMLNEMSDKYQLPGFLSSGSIDISINKIRKGKETQDRNGVTDRGNI